MPTAGREQFVPKAVEYFRRQDYPRKELVVVDDGDVPVRNLLYGSGRVVYIRLHQRKQVVGVKRNHACDAANGDIIVHWDDDDWYAPDWISRQVKTLIDEQADICGLDKVFFYDPTLSNCWQYVYPENEQKWVYGATLAYWKKFWHSHRFGNMHIGEDNHFVWHSGGRVAAHSHHYGFMAIIHAHNTSRKETGNVRWVPTDNQLAHDLLRNDLEHYRQIFRH